MRKNEFLDVLVRVLTSRMVNEVHLEFHMENRSLFTNYNPTTLGIAPLFAAYSQAIEDEDTAMEQIRRSADTQRIAEADAEFDDTFAGMHTYQQACLKHSSTIVREAAENLDVVFRKYGNIGKHAYREELAMSHNLLQDLNARITDVNKISLGIWITAHQQAATKLHNLIDHRSTEIAGRTDLHVLETRNVVDHHYQLILARLEAMININGVDYVPGFVAAYNEHATEYRNTLAQHLGRIHKSITNEDSITN